MTAYYDFPAWQKTFRQSNCLSPATRLEVGNCPVVAEVLRIAAAEQAMLIAVAWSQDLSPGRAELVTALLSSTRVPLLLLPVATALRRPASLMLAHSALVGSGERVSRSSASEPSRLAPVRGTR